MNTSTKRLGMGVGLALTTFALSVAAAEPARPAPAAAPVDYGKGFERLAALGLPDTATGTYARLQLNGTRDSTVYAWEYEMKMQGNGWVLQAPGSSPGKVVSGQARMLTVWDPRVLAKLRSAEARTNASAAAALPRPNWQPSDSRITGTWKPADFTNDLARALAYIEGTNTAARSGRDLFAEDGDSSSDRRRLDELQGPLFLLATHAWRAGRTNEANRIAAGLFAAAGDPRKVILAAVNHLADEQYEQAFARFGGDQDWAGFQAELARLLQRFPQGWRKRAGVALLASNVAVRVAGPAPDIAGEGITEADKALARDLAAVTTAPAWDAFGSLWLLDPPATNVSTDVFERLAARKAGAVPLLAALADDGWLLPLGRDFLQRWGGYSGYWNSDDDDGQKARQIYERLERPVSRGDIALKLLRQIVLAGENSYETARKSPDEIRALALEFHKAHGTKSPIELARLYFAEGSGEQRQAAAQELLQSPDTNDLALVEARLAEAGKVSENSALLRQYVNARGAAARPLIHGLAVDLGVETNMAAAKPAAKPGAGEGVREERGRGQYERKQIKELLALVSDQSLESLLADVGSGKATPTSRRLLAQRLGQGDRNVALTAVLEAAGRATNAATRGLLVGQARSIRHSSGEYYHSPARQRAAARAWRPELARHQAQWAALLADERPLEAGATVATEAAEAIEELYAAPPAPPAAGTPEAAQAADDEAAEATGEESDDEDDAEVTYRSTGSAYMMAYYQREPTATILTGMLGARGRAFLLARARARVAGTAETALAPYPSVESVKPPRRKELADQLGVAGAAAKVIEALSLDERLWLASALDRNTNLNARLVPLSLRIVDVTGPDGDDAAAALAATWKGRALDAKIVQALVDHVQAQLKAGKPRFVTLQRQPAFDGVSIRIGPAAAGDGRQADMLAYFVRQARGLAPAVVGIVDGNSAVWPLAPEAAPAAPAAGKGGSEVDLLLAEALAEVKADASKSAVRQQERFWKHIESFNVYNAAVDRTVQFMAVEAAQAAAGGGEDDDDDTEGEAVF